MARTAKIELKQSICTDTPTGADLFALGDAAAKHLKNTGMERNGGITPIFEQETTFPTAGVSTMIAKDGTVVQVDASNNVRLDDHVIGNIGPLAIAQRGVLSGYLDAAWTADATLIAINRVGTSMFVYEIDPATGLVLHSRSNAFAGFPAGVVTNICLIRYVDMHYADNQEFIVQITSAANPGYVLRESGTSTTVILTANATFFCWRFATSKYIYGKPGFKFWWGDLTSSSTVMQPAATQFVTNIIIDRFPGTAYSRAILSKITVQDASGNLIGYGEAGYTSAGVFTGGGTYYGLALGAVVATVNNPIFGLGYSECTFTRSDTGTKIYYQYAAPFAHNVAAYYSTVESQTNTPINGYGKLTDLYNATTGANNTNLVAWRIGWINGQPSFISAAPIGITWDCIGVPITNVGEFDETYIPHIDDNGSTYSRILYRYNGQLFYVSITSTAIHTLQKVSDNLYTVNCLSALNAIDIKNKKLLTGSNDYNGRLIWSGPNATTIIATYKAVAIIQGAYSNSIDFGDKLSTKERNTAITDNNIFCPGINPPSFWDRQNDFYVNFYIDDLYSTSYQTYDGTVARGDMTGLLYVPDTRIPFGMGYQFQERTMQTEVETIFTGVGVVGSADIDFDYLCYELGNDIPGLYQSFVLFGQTFLFDGKQIWFASFNGSLFDGRGSQPVCPATGMQLIASSPTEIFFLSLFDDSIYSFDGGRSLRKVERMNDLRNSIGTIEPILNGVFSVRDNALLLQTAGTFIWVRDKIVSQNNKKANQTAIALYDTINGIAIANNTLEWIYSFFALSASTIIPLTWQSGYFGVTENKLGIFSAFIATIFSANKIAASVMFTVDGFDSDGEWHEDIPFNIKPGDWTPLGFYRPRIVPQHTVGLALSIGMKTSNYLVLNEMVAEFTPSVSATPAASRSK